MALMEGRVCLVTGAARGIGAATARRLAEEGATVWASDKDTRAIEVACGELASRGLDVRPLTFDVCDERAARQAVMHIRKESGRLDVLVNNAGVMRDALIGMVTRDLMEQVFSVNVFGAMSMLQLAAKLMVRQGSGSIVNLASIVGVEGSAGQMVYSASKGAVAAMTKAAAKELAPRGVRVNAVAPGMVDTDLFRGIGEDKAAKQIGHIRMGRLGTPEDVADAILFLASDLSRYVTGEVLGVDGEASV